LPRALVGSTEEHPAPGLQPVAQDWGRWRELWRCPMCCQHWQLDIWDKLQTSLAIKVAEPDRWQTFDDIPARLDFLIRSRGGLSDARCVWRGCGASCLKQSAYCPTHAFEVTGARV
jgi:hypothetical protein